MDRNDAADWIRTTTYACSPRGLDNLFIMCHGGAKSTGVHSDVTAQSIEQKDRGLQIGTQNLLLSNLNVTAILNGLVSKITLLACNIAETDTSAKIPPTTVNCFAKIWLATQGRK